MAAQIVEIPRVKLGSQGLEISKLGFGCMGLNGFNKAPVPEEVAISIIKDAFSKGITFFDTSDVYGPQTNEVLIGKMGELKKLAEEGKTKYIGLSEAGPDTIRRAYAIHPITAVQLEWSLWTHEIEEEIVPLCRELGIRIVPYSSLGCGFFGGKAESDLPMLPRLKGENFEKNKNIYFRMEKLAQKHGCTSSQLTLAWLLHQGDDVVPILGMTKTKNLDTNISTFKVKLTKEDLKEISNAIPESEVAGTEQLIF